MKNKLQGIIATICIIIIIGFGFGGAAVTNATQGNQDKITVCHPTGSQSHPYTVNTISVNSELAGDFLYLGPTNVSNETKVNWCIDHKPKPTATPTPTPKKEDCDRDHNWFFWNWNEDKCITPTPTVAPTPTIALCFTGDEEILHPCPTDTPTASPSANPTNPPSNDGNGGGSVNNTPVCTVPLTSSPLLQEEVRNSPTSVTFSWWPIQGGADHYAIVYGYAADKLSYGQDDINGEDTSITLNSLVPNTQIFAKITAYKGACSSDSGIFSNETIPQKAPSTGRAEN